MNVVYLDNAATTRVHDEVVAAMATAMTKDYGNPSSAHRLGVAARRLIDEARQRVASALGAEASEICFTSGGTEANALGTRGAAGTRARHAVVSAIEHPSVAESVRRLGAGGCDVTVVPSGRDGVVPAAAIAEAVRPETCLVALMLVSNEIGTIQPCFDAARLVKARAPEAHFHVDAVQAVGKIALRVDAGPIDSLSLSAHKIHGPKGIGALWVRRGARLSPLSVGGGQEGGLRPGTENLPGAVGLGLAVARADATRPEVLSRMAALRQQLVDLCRAALPAVRVHGEGAPVAPHILSLGFPGIRAEPLLHALESRNVFVSAGSACASKDRRPSATLRGIGADDDVGTLRFSFSGDTTEMEIEVAGRALAAALAEVRL